MVKICVQVGPLAQPVIEEQVDNISLSGLLYDVQLLYRNVISSIFNIL
jgi:hypothetical protein